MVRCLTTMLQDIYEVELEHMVSGPAHSTGSS